MPLTAAAPLDAASPSTGATVSFLASIDINGQTVPINTGDITRGISNLKFTLTDPVDIGSINDFLNYLNANIGVPLTASQLSGYIDAIPSSPAFLQSFKDAIKKIFATDLIVTVLQFDAGTGSFALGVAFPLDLKISFITLNTIGVVVKKPGTPGSP